MIETGSALNHIDLLDKLRTFLVSVAGWTELEYSGMPSPYAATDQVELHVRAPGWLTGHECYVNIRTMADASAGAYGWRMNLSQAFDTALPDNGQVGASPYVYMNMWQNAMTYWFYANDRRVIVVAKVNTSYVSTYLGGFLPFALPSERPRPFYIGSNYKSLAAHDLANNQNAFLIAPGQDCAFYLDTDASSWRRIESTPDNNTAGSLREGAFGYIWPWRTANINSGNTVNNEFGSFAMFYMRPTINDELPLWKAHIVGTAQSRVEGVLEGVYVAPGFGRSSEQILSLSGQDYRCFQNIFRTTPRDFMAIEEL